jgi:hypothetical protein
VRVGLVRSAELRDSSHAERRKMTSLFWGGESVVCGRDRGRHGRCRVGIVLLRPISFVILVGSCWI